ncbi:MAG: NAD(P)/FAD-dependent oxidoreductase [Clostridiales bacterium]|nr:NAD(P)/FAD-dependent oxidoreductase [Clostridiales bacterium]
MSDILIVGGGAAGLMAAITAAGHGASVTLAERNEKVGRKLYITGKGRCNVTNDCTAEEALQNLPQGGKFLYSAMNRFPPEETKRFFTGLGVPLKTERGNRVFPVSDRAADIIDALFFEAKRLGVDIVHSRVESLTLEAGAVTGVRLEGGGSLPAGQVIVATGGCSYPGTGSTGDGYRLARQAGHTVTPIRGSLVPLVERGDACARMQGLALKNVAIQVKNQKGKAVYRDFGELLFTHFGLSGPMILSASAHLRDFDKNEFSVIIDMKPALEEKALDERILRDFGENRNRTLQNSLGGLLPRLMIPVVIEHTGIPPETKIHDITRAQRRALLEQLKGFRVDISGPRPVEDAIVTSGGVRLSEVNPSTMASKRAKGLYFAGEVLDVDGYTGGFNLQVAWATGYAAGLAAAEQAKRREEGCA